MSKTRTAFEQFFDDDSIVLPPIKSKAHPEGKVYTIPSPDFATGVVLQQLAGIAQRVAAGLEVTEEETKRVRIDDDGESDFAATVLGTDLLEEMKADGVPWGPIRNAVQYAFMYYGMSPDAADRLTAPKAQAPARAPKPKRRK